MKIYDLKERYAYYYNTLKEVTIDCRLQVSWSTNRTLFLHRISAKAKVSQFGSEFA